MAIRLNDVLSREEYMDMLYATYVMMRVKTCPKGPAWPVLNFGKSPFHDGKIKIQTFHRNVLFLLAT